MYVVEGNDQADPNMDNQVASTFDALRKSSCCRLENLAVSAAVSAMLNNDHAVCLMEAVHSPQRLIWVPNEVWAGQNFLAHDRGIRKDSS